jgi:outer membrane protein OmpA-like peptidoglycan-associated protein
VPKGLSKQASVLFNANSFALSDNTNATLNDLAFSLKTALASGASRVELVGYGGHPGSTSSSARRLSLERALAVRQALIADGVPAERIDVRALGGVPANDHGATDRVDIFIKS